MSIFSRKFVGIDFHDYYAQLVELQLSGDKISLDAYNRVLIPPSVIVNGEIQQEEDLKNILKNLLLQANPNAVSSKDIGIIFPSTKVFHHIFSFPKTLKNEQIKKSFIE